MFKNLSIINYFPPEADQPMAEKIIKLQNYKLCSSAVTKN